MAINEETKVEIFCIKFSRCWFAGDGCKEEVQAGARDCKRFHKCLFSGDDPNTEITERGCKRFPQCPFAGDGCRTEIIQGDCYILDSVPQDLSTFSKMIKEKMATMITEKMMTKRGFHFGEEWYQRIKEKLLKGGPITEKELKEAEERGVDEFFREQKERR